MLRTNLIVSSFLALAAISGCGDDGFSGTYPPFPANTKAPDAAPTPDAIDIPQVTPPIINEVYYGVQGADDFAQEYVEIFGDPNTDYSSYAIVMIEGDSGTTGDFENLIPLGMTNGTGHLAVVPDVTLPIENSSQTFLLVQGLTSTLMDLPIDLDTVDAGDAFDVVAPWTRIVDAVAIDDGGMGDLFYTSVGGVNHGPVLPRTTPANQDGGGFALIPDGTDTDAAGDWKFIPPDGVAADDTEADATKDAANTVGPPP